MIPLLERFQRVDIAKRLLGKVIMVELDIALKGVREVFLLDQGGGAMPVRHGHPAPGSREPQKNVGAPPRPK